MSFFANLSLEIMMLLFSSIFCYFHIPIDKNNDFGYKSLFKIFCL